MTSSRAPDLGQSESICQLLKVNMFLVFICLDWIAPAQHERASEESGLCLLQPIDAREECISMLAACIDRFEGAYPVLATRRMMGRSLGDVRHSLKDLQGKIRDSVNTTGESAYELVSDLLVASSFLGSGSFEWVAIAGAQEGFPREHWHRVVEFSGAAMEFEAACRELAC